MVHMARHVTETVVPLVHARSRTHTLQAIKPQTHTIHWMQHVVRQFLPNQCCGTSDDYTPSHLLLSWNRSGTYSADLICPACLHACPQLACLHLPLL
jgi:hypothetical protein